MKFAPLILQITQLRKFINRVIPTTGNSIAKNVAIALAVIVTSITFILPASADSGGIQMQFEFSLDKTPKFRQFNLALQNESAFGHTNLRPFEEKHDIDFNALLYSTNIQSPGLINFLLPQRLHYGALGQASSDSNDSRKRSAGAVLIGIGVLGLIAYGIKDDMDKGCSGSEVALSVLLSQGYGSSDWCQDNESL